MSGHENWQLQIVKSATSTSDLARMAAETGKPGKAAFLAIEQTAGRGRHGRLWSSQKGGMYLSVLLRPKITKTRWFGYSFVAALAVADVVSGCIANHVPKKDRPETGLKWPNDVLVDGGKIAGILLEAQQDSLIIGSGVNIALLDTVPDGRFAPVALASFLPSGCPLPTPEDLAAVYLKRLERWSGLLEEEGFAPIRAAWLERAVFRGKLVEVTRHETVTRGIFTDLQTDGTMLLLDDLGKTHHITTGDVQLLGDYECF